jgi:hypothetical protein
MLQLGSNDGITQEQIRAIIATVDAVGGSLDAFQAALKHPPVMGLSPWELWLLTGVFTCNKPMAKLVITKQNWDI